MILLSLAVSAAVLAAQSAAPQVPAEDDPILVEGQRRPTHKEALRTVTDLTMIVESQIARRHWPVCPLVLGLERRAAAAIESRIRKRAAEIGARVDRPKCESNLIVFVSGDGARLVDDLQKRRPRWFLNVSSSDTRDAVQEGPVRSWAAVSLRNERGHTIHNSASRASADPPWINVYTASILRNATFYNIDGSAIVIDADAIEGLTLGQVADYSVMRGLARIRVPENAGKLDSILGIFDRPKGQGPRELTAFDRRYLRELYEHLGNKGYDKSIVERNRLAKAIAEEE